MRLISLLFLLLITTALILPGSFFLLKDALLAAGWSWTLTEWTPYLLLVICGGALSYVVSRMLVGKNRAVRWSLIALILIAPFAIGFAEHPIYEDSISNVSDDMRAVKPMVDYVGADLVVIAIADCPYCKRATQDLIQLHERNPQMRLRMVVCTADSVWMQPYIELAYGAFEVVQASDMDVMATHAAGHFPSYVLVKKNAPFCRWNNNQWGPLAKDEVERGEG